MIEWCAQASEAFTPSDCYSFLEDNLGRSGLDSTDIDRSMRVLAYLDLLTLVEEKSSPLSGQLIARGANIKTGTTELTPTCVQYEKSPSFSEVSALEAVIETVTSRAAEANWPLGSKTQAALDDMRDRIDYLRENSDPRIIGRGISSHKSATNRHTWDSLPLL